MAAFQGGMAILLIPWVCLSMIICLALLRTAARPVSKPRRLPANAKPDPVEEYIAALPKTDFEREFRAARDVA
jgi:hypothetical protein